MKGKIFTIAGIVLIFGYFIWDSLHDPINTPGAVVLSGNDTLGRDWGAAAEAKEKAAAEANASNATSDQPLVTAQSKDLLSGTNPYQVDKVNQSQYQTIQSADGRTIITGYDREEEHSSEDRYKSRHQLEREANGESNPFESSYNPYQTETESNPYNPYGTSGQQNQPINPY